MLSTILTFLKSKIGVALLVGLLALGVGAWLHKHFEAPTTTTTLVGGTPQVKVESPTLTSTIIDRVVTDPTQQAAIDLLLKENNALKIQVTQLTSSTASATSGGGTAQGGALTRPVQGNTGASQLPPGELQLRPDRQEGVGTGVGPQASEFKDFQLDAKFTTDSFSYNLAQSFRIVESTGKDKSGAQVSLVKLFQDTPKGLVEVPTTTTVVAADPLSSRWMLSPRIQAGIGFNPTRGGLVILQWLKHGSSSAAEDVSWAFASGAVYISGNTILPVVLPVSFNLGTIKHNPLTNVWISPFVDSSKKFGIVFSATF